jgi:hypothetical protein
MMLVFGCTSLCFSGKILCVISTTFLPSTVDLSYKATKGRVCVVITEECNVMGNSEQLIGTTGHMT